MRPSLQRFVDPGFGHLERLRDLPNRVAALAQLGDLFSESRIVKRPSPDARAARLARWSPAFTFRDCSRRHLARQVAHRFMRPSTDGRSDPSRP
jgi:hypothetical protein